MITKHTKSSCCDSKISRFGKRRRQCTKCKKTWSIRKKKRGRPNLRINNNLIKRVLVDRYTVQQLAEHRGMISAPTARYRFRKSMSYFIKSPRVFPILHGPLLLLADGMRFQFEGKIWVLYLTAIKPCDEAIAYFLDPILIPGNEGASRWEYVFAVIPTIIKSEICGIIVDNLNGIKKIAQKYGWKLQLCHFHMIHKLQFHRRGQRRALKGHHVREKIYDLIRSALELPEGEIFDATVTTLRKQVLSDCGTSRMQAVLREFLNRLEDYRVYRCYPEFNFPTTTNVMESMGSNIRNLLRRNHSANNPKSLLAWTTAFIRLNFKFTCNSKSSTD